MERPNVFLLVMDTVRPDHLSCYGYRRNTTPNIDTIAQHGILFENAFCTANWTPPAHASIFTGTYPSKHGVLGDNMYLSDKNITMAQILSSHGYKTLGFSEVHVSEEKGFARGFDTFVGKARPSRMLRMYPFESIKTFLWNRLPLPYTTSDSSVYAYTLIIKKWLKKNYDGKKPFHIFVNFANAHPSYLAPKYFKDKFGKKVDPGIDLKKLKELTSTGGHSYNAGRVSMTDEEWDVVKSWYDAAIAYLDYRFGEILNFLKRIDAYDDTMIIIVSDHGESFGEHHLYHHQYTLHDHLIHVPLIISYPKKIPMGLRVSELVSVTDILPTVLDVVGIDIKKYKGIQGRSLLPVGGEYHPYVFAEYSPFKIERAMKRFPEFDWSLYGRDLKCIRTKTYKYILASNGEEELYNIEKDPGETQNLAKLLPDKARSLRKALNDWLNSFEKAKPPPREVEEDIYVKKRLRELGYL